MAERDACPAQTTIGPELARQIVALEAGTWEYTVAEVTGASWNCDLNAGHHGAHLTHVQSTSADEDHWLRWAAPAGVPELAVAPVCEAQLLIAADDDLLCLLVEGHDGPHRSGRRSWDGTGS